MAEAMGRPVAARGALGLEHVVLGIGVLFVVVTLVLPLVALGGRLGADGHGQGALLAARTWALFGRSIAFAAAVTVGAVGLGVPAGAIFARARIPGRRVLFGAHVAPLFVPPFVSALGWSHLVTGSAARELFFGPVGAWVVLTLSFAPVVTALTALGLASLDPSLEEAARLVARPLVVLTRIAIPAVLGHVALAALIVFALAFAELGVPMFLRFTVYPSAVFARLGGVDFAVGEAAALSVPAGLLALALTWAERRVRRRSDLSFAARAAATEPVDVGRAPVGIALFLASASLAPFVALSSVAWPRASESLSWVRDSVGNGLRVSVLAAAVATLVAVPVGHALSRRGRAARAMDALMALGFFLPSAVLGVGLVAVWNRPATSFVYGSAAILVLALLARYSVLGVRTVGAVMAHASPAYEEAAALVGAGYGRRLLHVVAPMHARAIAGAFGLVLVFCLRDLETVVLLYPPGGEPLTVRIFTLEANGAPGVVASLAVLQVVVTGLALACVGALASRVHR